MALDFDGTKYAQASAHQKEWGKKLIDDLDLKGDERILDLGCGDGVLTLALAERVPRGQVVGVDASPGMLEAARQQYRGNLSFVLLDINDMTYQSEFDVVFSNATLHFVKNHERLLKNVHRALRDSGIARCNFAADGNCIHYFQVVRETMRLPKFAPFFRDFEWPYFMPDVDAYRTLVGQSPFRKYEVWRENADRYFPNEEAMTKWLDQPSLVPFLKAVDASDKQAFRDTVVTKMIALTRQEDGTCFETFRRVNIVAEK
jgi:trans-aconitate methyltransferase